MVIQISAKTPPLKRDLTEVFSTTVPSNSENRLLLSFITKFCIIDTCIDSVIGLAKTNCPDNNICKKGNPTITISHYIDRADHIPHCNVSSLVSDTRICHISAHPGPWLGGNLSMTSLAVFLPSPFLSFQHNYIDQLSSPYFGCTGICHISAHPLGGNWAWLLWLLHLVLWTLVWLLCTGKLLVKLYWCCFFDSQWAMLERDKGAKSPFFGSITNVMDGSWTKTLSK